MTVHVHYENDRAFEANYRELALFYLGLYASAFLASIIMALRVAFYLSIPIVLTGLVFVFVEDETPPPAAVSWVYDRFDSGYTHVCEDSGCSKPVKMFRNSNDPRRLIRIK